MWLRMVVRSQLSMHTPPVLLRRHNGPLPGVIARWYADSSTHDTFQLNE